MADELSLENVESITIEAPEGESLTDAPTETVDDLEVIDDQPIEEEPQPIIIIEAPPEGDLSSASDDQLTSQAIAEATIDLIQQTEIQSLSQELAQVRSELFQALQTLQEQVNSLQASGLISSPTNVPETEVEAEISDESTAPPKKHSKSLLAKLLT